MNRWHRVYILLGTNMGDRKEQLSRARQALAQANCRLRRTSSIYETAPWGIYDQPNFLNQVLEIETTLSPRQLLELTQELEENAGPPKEKKWGPRYLDVDLLFYDDKIIDEPDLKIPHPALHQRDFTLIPLVEIAPNYQHPVLKQSLRKLLERSTDDTEVHKLQDA